MWLQSRDIDEEIGLGLVRDGPPELQWRYLDYLVCQRGSSEPALHTQLALTLADVALQLQEPSGATYTPSCCCLLPSELDQLRHTLHDHNCRCYNHLLLQCDAAGTGPAVMQPLCCGRLTSVLRSESGVARSKMHGVFTIVACMYMHLLAPVLHA